MQLSSHKHLWLAYYSSGKLHLVAIDRSCVRPTGDHIRAICSSLTSLYPFKCFWSFPQWYSHQCPDLLILWKSQYLPQYRTTSVWLLLLNFCTLGKTTGSKNYLSCGCDVCKCERVCMNVSVYSLTELKDLWVWNQTVLSWRDSSSML